MYYLIVDTCAWIDLCKKFPELQEKIVSLVDRNKVKLILPSTIVIEWNRQKSKILEERIQSVRGMIKNAKSLSEYLDPEAANTFKGILDRFQERKDKVEKVASTGIQYIERLFTHTSTIILEITDTAKLQAVDYALAKKAPFRNKNSMADGLIIFRVTEYIAKEDLSNCIFVSSNTQDFSSPSNPSKIHEDLRELFTRNSIRYFTNIGLAINEVEANLVSKESILKIEETVKEDALREALNSINEYDRQLMESMGGLSAIQEANCQFVEKIKIAGGSAMEEAFRSIYEYDSKLMESIKAVGDFPAIQETIQASLDGLSAAMEEANLQFMESIKIAGDSGVEESFHTIHEQNRKLMESIKSAGDFSAVQETIKTAMGGLSSAMQDTHSQFIESLKATSVSSVWQETFRNQEESIKALSGISGIQDAMQMANEADRHCLESIKMSSGFSEMADSFRSVYEQDRQMKEAINKNTFGEIMKKKVSEIINAHYGVGAISCEPSKIEIDRDIQQNNLETRSFQGDKEILNAEWIRVAKSEKEYYALQKKYHSQRIAFFVVKGWDNPISLHRDECTVEDGLHRLKAAIHLKMEVVNVTIKDNLV
jgi:hypothetical protein